MLPWLCNDNTPSAAAPATHTCGCNKGWIGGDAPGEQCTDFDECQDNLDNFLRNALFFGEHADCDETSSKCQEIAAGMGAYCRCNHGYHWPRPVLETGVVSDHLERWTRKCFPINECTGQIVGQTNPDENYQEGKVPSFQPAQSRGLKRKKS